jgi:hypothetical protein
MKKIIALLMIVCTISVTAFAQTTKESKDKVRKTSNVGQKVHNTFSKHKHYNGYKVKRKREVNGHMVKEKKVVKTDQ